MESPSLNPGECHVWWLRPSAIKRCDPCLRADTPVLRLLDDLERSRAESFLRDGDRRRYVFATVLARAILSAYLGIEPSDVPLDRSCDRCGRAHGRPRLRQSPGRPIELSITHSGDRVAVAVTSAAPVGIDVERVAPRSADKEIVAGCLTPYETDALQTLPTARRWRGFLTLWTRKEAALKAYGLGLGISPSAVEVSPAGVPPRLLRWPLATPPESVRLHALRPGDGYVASLAVVDRTPPSVLEFDGSSLAEAVLVQ